MSSATHFGLKCWGGCSLHLILHKNAMAPHLPYIYPLKNTNKSYKTKNKYLITKFNFSQNNNILSVVIGIKFPIQQY